MYSRWDSPLVVPTKRRFENQKSAKTKKQALCFSLLFDLFVLKVGIEPTRPKSLDFESSAFNTKIR